MCNQAIFCRPLLRTGRANFCKWHFLLCLLFHSGKGSSESKSCDIPEEVDREPNASRPGAPWPVRKEGLVLQLYKNSLTLALTMLFLLSWILHFYGSFKDENEHLSLKGEPLKTMAQYLSDPRCWFESFQNWQSEFLSVFPIVVLSIFLRQKGSPESKPVDASDEETGE